MIQQSISRGKVENTRNLTFLFRRPRNVTVSVVSVTSGGLAASSSLKRSVDKLDMRCYMFSARDTECTERLYRINPKVFLSGGRGSGGRDANDPYCGSRRSIVAGPPAPRISLH